MKLLISIIVYQLVVSCSATKDGNLSNSPLFTEDWDWPVRKLVHITVCFPGVQSLKFR